MPAIEVVWLDHRALPSAGAGEAPIVGIAPAIGNATLAAWAPSACARGPSCRTG